MTYIKVGDDYNAFKCHLVSKIMFLLKNIFQEGQPIYIAVKGVVFDVTSGKGELSLKKEDSQLNQN